MVKKQIGKRIRQRREELGLTRDRFAEKIDISVTYLSMIERGESFPRYEVLIKLINGLETSADFIFCDVLNHTLSYKESVLSEKLEKLPHHTRNNILKVLEYMIHLADSDPK